MAQKARQPSGRGCLLTLVIIVLLFIIGTIANACSGSSTPVNQPVSPPPTAAPSPSLLGSAPPVVPSPTRTQSQAPPPTPTRSQPRPRHHRYVPPPTTTAPPQPACYPKTDSGNCYEPGEFCRDSDHGAYGVAGDGEKIRCEDNNGWRWEPV